MQSFFCCYFSFHPFHKQIFTPTRMRALWLYMRNRNSQFPSLLINILSPAVGIDVLHTNNFYFSFSPIHKQPILRQVCGSRIDCAAKQKFKTSCMFSLSVALFSKRHTLRKAIWNRLIAFGEHNSRTFIEIYWRDKLTDVTVVCTGIVCAIFTFDKKFPTNIRFTRV